MMNNGNDFIPGSECPSNSSRFSFTDYSTTMIYLKRTCLRKSLARDGEFIIFSHFQLVPVSSLLKTNVKHCPEQRRQSTVGGGGLPDLNSSSGRFLFTCVVPPASDLRLSARVGASCEPIVWMQTEKLTKEPLNTAELKILPTIKTETDKISEIKNWTF